MCEKHVFPARKADRQEMHARCSRRLSPAAAGQRRRLLRAFAKATLLVMLLTGLTGLRSLRTTAAVGAPGAETAGRRLLDDGGDNCSQVRDLHSRAEQCEWVQNNCSNETGLFPYLQLYYCSAASIEWLVYIVLFGWMVVLFVLIGDVAEIFLSASLERIAEMHRMSPSLAGVTLLALANGCSDLATIIAGILSAGSSAISLGEPIGAGTLVTSIVTSLCIGTAPFNLTRHTFLRDNLFYLGAVILIGSFCLDGEFSIFESLSLLAWYAIYVAVVVVGERIWNKRKQQELQPSDVASPGAAVISSDDDVKEEQVQIREDGREEAEEDVEDDRSPLTPHRSKRATDGETISKPSNRQVVLAVNDEDLAASEAAVDDGAESTSLRRTRSMVVLGVMWVEFHRLIAWHEKNIFEKALFPILAPFTLLLHATIPQARRWSRLWTSISVVGAPVLTLVAVNYVLYAVNGFPLAVMLLLVFLPFSILLHRTTDAEKEPRFFVAVLFACFSMSAVWSYLLANELVFVLQSVGIIFGVSDAILALTVLAFGNSIADAVADPTVNKAGLCDTAMGAILASPMLNALIGLGFALTYVNAVNYPVPFQVDFVDDLKNGLIYLVASLLSILIGFSLNGFRGPKWLMFWLPLLYAGFMATSILCELGFIAYP